MAGMSWKHLNWDNITNNEPSKFINYDDNIFICQNIAPHTLIKIMQENFLSHEMLIKHTHFVKIKQHAWHCMHIHKFYLFFLNKKFVTERD